MVWREAQKLAVGSVALRRGEKGTQAGRVPTATSIKPVKLAALKKAGWQTVFKDEGISGATTKRPALLRCLKKLEHGETLIVWKLDRLGRSLRDKHASSG